MRLMPRALPRLLHTVLLALLICVAAATATVLHAASTSHDADVAASVIVLDATPAAHAPVDGGGVADCLGAVIICVAAIGLLVLVTAQARRSARAEPLPAAGSAPPRPWLLSFQPVATRQITGLLRI